MLSDWGELRKPDVFTGKNVGIAIALHLAFFALCWLLSIPLPNKEIAIPIDLTVVVNENLDGDPDEPPPEAPPVRQPDPPPSPPPQPKVETPPPAPPEEVKQDAVVQEKPKEKKVEKKPEKTKEELQKERQDRLKKMRESAKQVKPEKQKPQPKQPTQAERIQKMLADAKEVGPPPKNNGKTDKRPDNWKDLLNQGYRPGATTQLAANENQRCISLIKSRFDTCWTQVGIPAWTDTLKEMYLSLKFSSSGKILSYSLARSSGDRRVDKTVLDAAKLMNAVYGLSPEFLESNSGNVTIRVKVLPK